MSFSENLKAIRTEKNLTQEQLAELLDVSRQAVSKWEQENGYPETEKLMQIAQKLDVSLDSLLLDRELTEQASKAIDSDVITFGVEKRITVQSSDGKNVASFYKFRINKSIFAKEGEAKYMLSGTDKSSFMGDNIVELGWYTNIDDARTELREIFTAMENGDDFYQLKYTTEIKPKRFGVIDYMG